MMIVAHNLSAMNAQRQFGINVKNKAKSAEKLSSGYKINRAADDATGLAMSEKMRRQIRGLTQGVKNTLDGVSLCQVADGALAEVDEMLHRITELSVQAANGTNTLEDRQYIQEEINEILREIDRIGDTTTFNERKLFDGSMTLAKEKVSYTYEQAKQQLMSAGFKQFGAGKVVLDGTEFESKDMNSYTACLSQYVLEDAIYEEGMHYKGPNNADTKELLHKISKVLDANYAIVEGDSDSPYLSLRLDCLDKAKELIAKADSAAAQSVYAELSGLFFPNGTNYGGMYEAFYTHSVSLFSAHGYSVLSKLQVEVDDYMDGKTTSPAWSFQKPSFYGGDCGAEIRNLLGGNVTSTDEAVEQYRKLLEGVTVAGAQEYDGVWIQSGCETGDGIRIGIDAMDTLVLGIRGLDVSTTDGADQAIESVKGALKEVSANRAQIGAQQNRLEHTVANEENIVENTTAAESRIRDTDMAQEMVRLANLNVLEQAGYSMMAQANQSNQGVIGLLV